MTQFTVISPVDGRTLLTRNYASWAQIAAAADAAEAAFPGWAATPLAERTGIVRRAVDWLVDHAEAIATDLAWSIGRPLHMADETSRLDVVTNQLILDAEATFEPMIYPSEGGITRYVKRAPRGLVLSICAWNYPVAMPANMIVAPLLAGDTVIFKHAPQTTLIGEWFARAFEAAGLPEGVFQSLPMDHTDVARLIREKPVSVIQFIGSTRGGIALREASASRPIELGLEMGGSDPAYVRADADLKVTVSELVSGSFGNSGQSCCSVERIYVHADIHDRFLEAFRAATGKLVLGHPISARPDLGPVVSAEASRRIRALVEEAVAAGATAILPEQPALEVADPSAYVSPQILAGADHDMRIMREEIFGPVVSVTKVADDDEAVTLMNDSRYALSASVWSGSAHDAVRIGNRLRCGTFYHNKCDYADLYLPWGGVGWSGLGRINGGAVGFGKLTEMKSYVLPEGEGCGGNSAG
ncbi:MAG: aldehyde dehydrogenase family protein [Hyphomicrobiaceae bacterium]|nr:aldehyde dehydrogenase family protein [Hyphomicrobiaceae bacterium]